MKKFFIISASILLFVIVVFCIFIFTFDANRYKEALINKLEESTGRDVMIDNISISFLRGLGIEIRGLVIKDRVSAWENPLLKARSINGDIKILPLLKKDIQVQRFYIPELIINTGSGTTFKSRLDLNVRILINSLSQDDMVKTLTANGNMNLEKGVLENMNVLKVTLDKLSMMPDLVQKLKNNLPEKYSVLLSQNYTKFNPIGVAFQIKDNRIFFDKVLVTSDAFYLTLKGSIGMDQDIDIKAGLFIPKDLSDAFINVTPEFKYLTGDDGVITMPLDIKGKIPDVSITPNLNYVLEKLIESKGLELLDKLFRRR